MKTIYFIRHAKSEQNIQCMDFERPLNKRGEKDAIFMAQRLKHFDINPNIIISSPAKRALKTAKIVAKTLGYSKKMIVKQDSLYDSSSKEYLEVIKNIDSIHKVAFIFGHNPMITEVCELLTDSIIGNIPTSGIFCVEFDVINFSDIKLKSGKVLFFDLPKKHFIQNDN